MGPVGDFLEWRQMVCYERKTHIRHSKTTTTFGDVSPTKKMEMYLLVKKGFN